MTSLGASATCGAGQAKAAAASKNKDEVTGWSGGTIIHGAVPEAAGEEVVGVFQSPALLPPDTSQLPGSSASPRWPRKLREAEGGGARMPMWVSAGLRLRGPPGGSRGFCGSGNFLFGSV